MFLSLLKKINYIVICIRIKLSITIFIDNYNKKSRSCNLNFCRLNITRIRLNSFLWIYRILVVTSKFREEYEKRIYYFIMCMWSVCYITLYHHLSRLRSLQMHYESEITLEYSTHTYECIKGTGGKIWIFLAYFNIWQLVRFIRWS